MNIEEYLIGKERMEYKCFDILKEKLKDEKFRAIILEGILNGKISGFPESLWEKIDSQNIRKISSFLDVFKEGANKGYCTVASKQLSYSLNSCYICGGVLPLLKGTDNCIDGSHTWVLENNQIIDSSLMLIIDISYAPLIGYIEENRYNPNLDPIYQAAKEYTNDPNIKRKR